MRSRAFITTAVALTLLLAVVGGVYAYDHAGRDAIPEGVRVAGIDVGGLDASAARAKLERKYLPKLQAPVRVNHGTNSFVLKAEQSGVAANLGAIVGAAVAQADSGNMFSRSFRRLTGGEVDVDLAPETTFDKGRVVRFLDGIRKTVDRDPIDAKVEFAASGLQVSESRVGLAVRASALHRQIRKAIVDPSADHTLVARTDHTEPKVGTDDIDRQYATAIIVDRASFRLRLYQDLKLVKTYPIAVGAVGLETPAGLYHIQNKAVNPAWTMPNSDWVAPADRGRVIPGGIAENPLKSRWLGVYDGVGVHGTSDDASIGTNASHGCIRMHVWDVEELYDDVPVGAPIFIA
ncbi:MAG: L,D-transpeptidase/peptidoglycan binding protein [Solirubrobacteraceae bacterium]